ncbi:S53 family peptidase [Rudaea sp.]|uniref:S53 family peptidase n=1 Tax=Rudaea sp. TaxID=2136325 RepID=UPI002ED629FC
MPAAVAQGTALSIDRLDPQQHLKLALSLPERNTAELDELLHNLQDPHSPLYHNYLSVEEFTSRFGPAQVDYDAVVAWAGANGLTVTETTPNRRLVDVEGSVAAINHAFGVQMTRYQHPNEDRAFFAPDREPAPVGLKAELLHVSGLDNFSLPQTHLKQASTAGTNAGGSGPGGQFLPSDMRAAYYGNGALTGSGQSIGIFSFAGYNASDVQLFYQKTGMTSSVPINNVLVNGFSGACNGCDDGEQVLDIVNSIGMAPGITQILFYEGSSATNILNKMASDNIAKILSCSWYGADFNNPTDDPIYKQMAAQGQTFINASGDMGAYNNKSWGSPSADPWVLEVGGTDLVTNGAGGSWSSETAWVDSGGGFYSGAGEATPSYQLLAGVLNSSNKGSTTYRNDPDVSAEANFDNPTVSKGQFLTGYGGTSFAAPRWAGFLALVNQQAVAKGHGPVGFVNPALYNVGLGTNYVMSFHDIISGSNPATKGTHVSYNAVTGFDLVTGWGSPQAALINVLAP